jgi:hypothetical protein
MRAGLALAVLLLCAGSVLAQGKTKASAPPASINTLEVCEAFAGNAENAEDLAREHGWTVEVAQPESPFLKTWNITRSFPGLGEAKGYVLIESYPTLLFGYCRVDLAEPQGEAKVALIDGLPRWQGSIIEQGLGTYGSWQGPGDRQRELLLAHEDQYSFVLQLTNINTHGAPFGAPAP